MTATPARPRMCRAPQRRRRPPCPGGSLPPPCSGARPGCSEPHAPLTGRRRALVSSRGNAISAGRNGSAAMAPRSGSARRAGRDMAGKSGTRPGVTPGERGLEQSFGRATAILDALAAAGGTGLRFVDIVRLSGLSQTTVHRMIAALSAHGIIEQDGPGARYLLGMRLAGWAFTAGNRFGLAEVARPIMD